eukprot:359953-Chlamydomonas_euryale.AAC.9
MRGRAVWRPARRQGLRAARTGQRSAACAHRGKAALLRHAGAARKIGTAAGPIHLIDWSRIASVAVTVFLPSGTLPALLALFLPLT